MDMILRSKKLVWLVCSLGLWASSASAAEIAPSSIIELPGAWISTADLSAVDFNGDGYKEIVAAGTDSNLHVIATTDGRNWKVVWTTNCNDYIEAAGPPTSRNYNAILAPPAVADLDGNGTKEIVVAVGREISSDVSLDTNGGVLVFTYTGAWNFKLIESLSDDGSRGWPQPRIDRIGKHPGAGYPDGFWDSIVTSPALADLDADGDLEIVIAGIDRRVHAYHHDGRVVAGWPIYRHNGDALLRGGVSSPAIADIDKDGQPEVIVATQSPYWDQGQAITTSNPDYATATIWAWNGDSSVVPGFPIVTDQWIHSSPALVDMDNDGQLEIVIGSGAGLSGGATNKIAVYNHDGTMALGWPQYTKAITYGSPTVVDVDRDGQYEVLVGCGTKYHANSCGDGNALFYGWNADGSVLTGFPTQVESSSWWQNSSDAMPFSPVVADIDGDGVLEILIAQTGSWGLTVLNANGTLQDKLIINIGQHGVLQAPVVDDIDKDGLIEVFVGGGDSSKGMIFIWDVEGPATPQPWPMSRLNLLRSGANLKDMAVRLPSTGQALPFIVPLLLDDNQRVQ
jgi:hypothetical protein